MLHLLRLGPVTKGIGRTCYSRAAECALLTLGGCTMPNLPQGHSSHNYCLLVMPLASHYQQ